MRLSLLFDHRFYRDRAGTIYSLQNYNYPFFVDRYLPHFDSVQVLARIASDPADPTDKSAVGERVQVQSLGNWNGQTQFLRQRGSVLERLHQQLDADSAVIMITPGVVGMSSYQGLLQQGRPYGVEVVGDPHDVFAPGVFRHPLRPVLRWWFTRNLRRQCAGAAAAAYVTQQALQRRYPCAGFSVGVSDVPDLQRVEGPREPVPASPLRLLTIASLAQLYKGTDVLIDAVGQLRRQDVDVELTIVGDGAYRAELATRARQLGIEAHVHFLGQLPAGDAVRQQLDRTDLFVLPSRTEGLPRALVEAMARAVPCLGSDVGGIPELLDEQDLVPPGDATALAGKIRQVIDEPTRLTEMSRRGWTRAAKFESGQLEQRRGAFHRALIEATTRWVERQ